MIGRHDARHGWGAIRLVARRQLAVGVGIVAARVFGFASGAIVARSLGPDGFGRYTLAFTIFSSLLQLTSFADTWLVSRWENAVQRSAVLATVWRVKAEAIVVMISGFTLFAIGSRVFRVYDSGTLLPTLLAVLTAGAGGLTTALAAIGQAERRYRLYTAAVAGPPFLTVLGSGVIAAAGVRISTPFVVVLFAAYLPLALYAMVMLRQERDHHVAPLRSDILSFGGWVTIGTVFYVVFQRIDLFLLGSVRSVSEVGLYGSAVRLSAVGALGASIVGAALMPVGSRATTWQDRAERRAYVRETGVAVAGITAFVGLAILFAPVLITQVFGAVYADAVPSARVLLLGQLVLGVQLPFYFALYALDGRRWIALISFAQLTTAVAAGAILSRPFGALGAAWSNALTYLIGAIGVGWYVLPRVRRLESAQ